MTKKEINNARVVVVTREGVVMNNQKLAGLAWYDRDECCVHFQQNERTVHKGRTEKIFSAEFVNASLHNNGNRRITVNIGSNEDVTACMGVIMSEMGRCLQALAQ